MTIGELQKRDQLSNMKSHKSKLESELKCLKKAQEAAQTISKCAELSNENIYKVSGEIAIKIFKSEEMIEVIAKKMKDR